MKLAVKGMRLVRFQGQCWLKGPPLVADKQNCPLQLMSVPLIKRKAYIPEENIIYTLVKSLLLFLQDNFHLEYGKEQETFRTII